ncbi:rna-directed dna polymerase reverse transcriptase and integrase domain containing, partial [Lasius niger]
MSGDKSVSLSLHNAYLKDVLQRFPSLFAEELDYSTDVNSALIDNRHPLPSVENIILKLNGSCFFNLIDLGDAFFQLEIDENHREITTITTPKELFRFKRLSFGIKTAPAIFQQAMDATLSGLEGVILARQTRCHALIDKFRRDNAEELQELYNKLKKAIREDPLLRSVFQVIKEGWKMSENPELSEHFKRRSEKLTIIDDTLFIGDRVVIRKKLKPTILAAFHKGHPGIRRTKQLAYVTITPTISANRTVNLCCELISRYGPPEVLVMEVYLGTICYLLQGNADHPPPVCGEPSTIEWPSREDGGHCKKDPVRYSVCLDDGRIIDRHINIWKGGSVLSTPPKNPENDYMFLQPRTSQTSRQEPSPNPKTTEQPIVSLEAPSSTDQNLESAIIQPTPVRPVRNRAVPKRLVLDLSAN